MHNNDVTTLKRIAEQLAVGDIFILRRVEGDRFVHVGGVGRGEGWAGLTEIRLNESAPARQAYDENRVTVTDSASGIQMFGPYWSTWAAFAPVDHDVMVVFGGRQGDAAGLDIMRLEGAAAEVAQGIEAVSPAKRLADELEILHAIQKLMATEPANSVTAMQHIVDCATEALSCEFGIVWLTEPELWAASRRGWDPRADMTGIAEALRDLRLIEDAPVCVQNASRQPLPAPFRAEDGVCSYYLLPIGGRAAMLLMHTHLEPRGFTRLCQELGRRLAESSEILLRTAVQRDDLARELHRVTNEARRDPLTGIANRLAWHEHLATLADRYPSQSVGVLCIDLDNLKRINDELGHEAGDQVIKAMAGILRDYVRPDDFVARLGGDEFAALLPDAGADGCATVIERLYSAARNSPALHGYPVRFKHGIAVCPPGGDIDTALKEADASLIEAKRLRQS